MTSRITSQIAHPPPAQMVSGYPSTPNPLPQHRRVRLGSSDTS